MKIAVISDVHGNIWALEAVLENIKQRKIDHIFDLGDSLEGTLEPQKTFELFKSYNIKSLKGNQDKLILDSIDKENTNQTIKYVINQLDQEALKWLNQLPDERILNDSVIMFHGTNSNNSEYLVEKSNVNYVGIKSVVELDKILSKIKQKTILCGHSHTPRLLETKNKTVINPGSVGLQAYDDELPIFNENEKFNPRAKYCILQFTSKLNVEFITVSYDFEKAALKAELNNRNDWAEWIRTGRI